MKRYFLLLIIFFARETVHAQVSFPFNGFNLLPVEGYYADLGLNCYWNATNGWSYLSNGPSVKLTLGQWNNSSDFVFQTAPVNANGSYAAIPFTEVMRIHQNGDVGIGTRNTGGHKLAVNGTIGARRIKVTQQTWADFVFAPAYRLPTLQEVEIYVKHHQHLPGIPSADAIARDGLDLGDIQQKQMQKIEELTLYVIDLSKKLDAQQAIINEQRRELGEITKALHNK